MSGLFLENLSSALESMAKGGAFLTVSDGQRSNTMTIGWGYVGYQWQKPVFVALVRKSRFTYEIFETATEFTVSIPILGTMKESLAYCGSKSGRDHNKFKEANLTLAPGKEVEVPIITGCGTYFECKVLYRQDMDPKGLDATLDLIHYQKKNNDYHTLFFGEILSSY